MKKLVYKCGNVIIVQTDDQSKKGSIIVKHDEEEFFDIISGNIGIELNRKPGGLDRVDWIIEELGRIIREEKKRGTGQFRIRLLGEQA